MSKVKPANFSSSATLGKNTSCSCNSYTNKKTTVENVDVDYIYQTLEKGLVRVAEKSPARLERVIKEVQCAARTNTNVAIAVSDFLQVDSEWQRLGRELGLVSPDGEQEPVALVCGGACLFAIGLAAGVVLGAGAASAGAAASG